MNKPLGAISLRPAYDDALHLERRSWLRVIAVHALATAQNEYPATMLRRTWPRDERAALILKGAVSPTTTVDFPPSDMVATFRSLAPGSAALQLFDFGLKLDMTGVSTVRVPNVAGLPPQPVFVGEGKPAPSLQWTFGAAVVGPVRKILVLSAVSDELENATPESAAAVIGSVLAAATVKSVDTVAFDANAGDAVRPPGLLNGVTPLTGTAGGGMAAMVADLSALVEAIGGAGIDPNDVVFVAPPHQATTMKATLGLKFTNPILTTLGLPAKTVAAFAPAAVASGYQGTPTVETSKEAVVHFEDTTPADISTPPNTVAAPSRSAFQTNVISVRVRANAAWGVAPGGAQVVQSVSW